MHYGQVVSKKYLKDHTILDAPAQKYHCISPPWRAIRPGATILAAGVEWRIGSRETISFVDLCYSIQCMPFLCLCNLIVLIKILITMVGSSLHFNGTSQLMFFCKFCLYLRTWIPIYRTASFRSTWCMVATLLQLLFIQLRNLPLNGIGHSLGSCGCHRE